MKDTFEHVEEWLAEVDRCSPSTTKMLVGNKTDLADQREVSEEQAKVNFCFLSFFTLPCFYSTSEWVTGLGGDPRIALH